MSTIMLLYTIIPFDQIFPQECDMQIETRAINGGFVELLKTPEGFNVSRLISTDPRLFLKGAAPGDKYL